MTLYDVLFSDPVIDDLLSDRHFIAEMLAVEVALAQVQANLGIIPTAAADRIAAASMSIDAERIKAGIAQSGVPTLDLVRQMREHVGGEAAHYVHWGATTQDIMDTALVLQLRAALTHIEGQLHNLVNGLAILANSHRTTLVAARTHSQQALPTTFGLKVAGWLAPLLRHIERLPQLRSRLLVVQLGGAAGTLASLGDDGLRVQAELAQHLGLGTLPLPWHTQRDNLAELAGWLSLVTGNLAKMAQDIILLAQTEVAEVRESADPQRGASSTLPQKRNPVISETIIAAARTNASLLSAVHQSLIQEHERATGSWQIEWLTLPQMLRLTAASLNRAVLLTENLVVNADMMRINLAASNGLLLAEALSLALAPHLGRQRAKDLVRDACFTAVQNNRHLVDVVREQTSAPLDWRHLADEAHYIGQSNELIERVLQQVERILS